MPVVCLFQRQATTKVPIVNYVKLLPQKQHTADSSQLTARPTRHGILRAWSLPHPSALILVLTLPCLVLAQYAFEKGTTLGRPDTIKILVSPQKVVERGDTILVLDEEWEDHLTLKRYTLDGFFISARPYVSGQDSGLFVRRPCEPDSGLAGRVKSLLSDEIHPDPKLAAVSPNGNQWVIYSYFAGDAGGYDIICLDPRVHEELARGWGPGVSAGYSIESYLYWQTGRFSGQLYLHAGNRYVYVIALDWLWLYDHHARFVRKVGVESNGAFKEPVGLAFSTRGGICVADFALGGLWEFKLSRRTRLQKYYPSRFLEPATATHLSPAHGYGFWIPDVSSGAMRLVRARVERSFMMEGLRLVPGGGGTNYCVAASDSILVVLRRYHSEGGDAAVFDTTGRFIRKFEIPSDEKHKSDVVAGLDNTANVYGRIAGRFFRLPPLGSDTTWIDLPPIPLPYRLDWQCCYRVEDTLYVLGTRQDGRDEPPYHGIYVFVDDGYSGFFDESDFEGGLRGWFTDFAVAPDGSFWFVDIGQRIVQEYRQVKGQSE